MRGHLRVRVLASLMLVVPLAWAQAPAAPNFDRPGKVWVSGENPGIRLLDKQDGNSLALVSYWRIHWSPYGPGHVCYVTTGDGKGPGNVRIALYDNQRLFEYLTKEILGTFDKTYLDQPFTPVSGAKFNLTGDSLKERRETCESGQYKVELVWRDFAPGFLRDILPGARTPNPFGLTYFRVPTRSAEIIINGRKVAGQPYPQGQGDSTAFLALGETWIK